MFRLAIETDNAAFCDAPAGYELARILRDLAAKLEREGPPAPGGEVWRLRDVNGNTCGTAWGEQ